MKSLRGLGCGKERVGKGGERERRYVGGRSIGDMEVGFFFIMVFVFSTKTLVKAGIIGSTFFKIKFFVP